MPHGPGDRRLPHLEVVREDKLAEWRRHGGRGGVHPDRGGRAAFSTQLRQATDRLESEQQRRRGRLRGVAGHLVFRVPFVSKPHYTELSALFERAGMSVVSVESDGAVVVFHGDESFQAFRDQIEAYAAGPQRRRKGKLVATTQFDLLEYIDLDAMTLWGRADRIGQRLAAVIGPDGEQIEVDRLYTVEMELWHPGDQRAAEALVDELRAALTRAGSGDERWLDQYINPALLLAKVRTSGHHLNSLLETESIASIDLPLAASFDASQAARATERDFPPPPAPPSDGPRLCIVDSGVVSNHPLLRPYIGHEEAILTGDTSPADAHGHGTRVAGLAIYGDVRACYEGGHFESTITLFSARVLNDANAFDDERLIVNQLRAAVETFVKPPYSCRVFNLSIGSSEPALGRQQRRQSLYGEVLDNLAREFGVLFVVSAGNHREVTGDRGEAIGEALKAFPAQLLRPEARLCDFATTALGLTVGALGAHGSLTMRYNSFIDDIVRPIALRDEPAPMTRVGPGVQDSIKPDLVHYGGSPVFDHGLRHWRTDFAMAIMSLSREPTSSLFAYDCGTSYAAPRVARLAALTEHRLRQQLATPPHPNLIRAMLAASARVPDAARARLHPDRTGDRFAEVNVCGYGLPDEEFVLDSSDRRVVLFAQAEIAPDYFHIYRVPVPESWLGARGRRSIIVALAFDPPARGRRLDYLGVEMDMVLVRGKTAEEVYEACRSVSPDEEAGGALDDRFKVPLRPPGSTRGDGGYKRDKGTLQRATYEVRQTPRRSHDGDYHLVVRAKRTWAPATLTTQAYAAVVVLGANSPQLYAQVRQRVRQRMRVRV